MMMNTYGLKPCPFCGREVKQYSVEGITSIGITRLQIECECGVDFDVRCDNVMYYHTKGTELPYLHGRTANEIWNKRAGEEETDE